MTEELTTYTLRHQARCIEALAGEKDKDLFLVGTLSVKGVRDVPSGSSEAGNPRAPNDLQLLEYNEDAAEVQCLRIYSHPGEVWGLASNPEDTSVFASIHSGPNGGPKEATIWKMGDMGEEVVTTLTSPLSPVESLDDHTRPIRAIKWGGQESCNLVSVDDCLAIFWKASADGFVASEKVTFDPAIEGAEVKTVTIDPFNDSVAVLTSGDSVIGIDRRTNQKTFGIKHAHDQPLTDLDFSPSKQNSMCSTGEDGCIRCWDLRRPSQSNSKIIADAHKHMALSCRYCPESDKLLATSGTDGFVRLWDTTKAFVEGNNSLARGRKGGNQGLVLACGEIERKRFDSIYSIAWCPKDRWKLGALSYDGRVIIHPVPQNVKYEILL